MLKVLKGCWKLVLVAVCVIGLLGFNADYAFAKGTSCVPEQPCLETIPQHEAPEVQKTFCLSEEQPCFSTTNQPKRQPKAICLPGQPCNRIIRASITTRRPVGDTAHPRPIPPEAFTEIVIH